AAELGKENMGVKRICGGGMRRLCGKGMRDLKCMLKEMEEGGGVRRRRRAEEVGDRGGLLLRDMCGGITGENVEVDCGLHI
ncbi:SDR family oxidoreductase, partial [Bacillus subtilis]|uniref:SDR family oxidoreductase n=1 Tax=Bacillus subtilis TaxID=1423 RepID=UPI00119EA450